MTQRDLKFRILGEDVSGGKTFKGVSHEVAGAHDALGKLGGQLSSLGGPFGIAQEAIEGIGGGLEHVKEHGKSVGSVLAGVGVAVTGASLLLTQFGAKDQQAQAQLRQSIATTGASYGDFREEIEQTIHSGERFGHTADDTQNALNSLTIATQSPAKALEEMGLVEDIAAKKHISLADASDLLIKAQEGNARAFKSFGIVLDGNGTKTEQINRALEEMSTRLAGQASSAADTWSGKLQAMKAHAEDVLASLAKYAPILTAVGPAATIAGAGMSFLAKQKAANVAADAALIPAETALAGAEIREAAAARAAGAARLGGGGALLGLGGIAAVAGVGAYLAHGYTTGQNAKSQAGLTAQATSGPEGLAAVQKQRELVAAHANSGSFGGVGKALLAQYDAAIKAAKGGDEAADSIKAIGQAAEKTTPAIDREIGSLHKHTDAALQAGSTADAFRRSLNDLKGSADEHSKTLRGTTDAAITNREALRGLAQQELAHIDALRAQGKGSAAVSADANRMSKALEAQAIKVFGNRREVEKFLGSLGVLPGQIRTILPQVGAAGKSIGAQLDAGITVGIQQGAGKVNLVSKQTIDGVVHIMQKAADMHSPSKKTQYIGEMLGEGLLVGWHGVAAKMLHQLPDSLEQVLTKLHDKIDAAVQKTKSRVQSARDQMTQDLNDRGNLAGNLAGNLLGPSDIAGDILTSTDANGDSVSKAGNLVDFLKGQADQIGAFRTTIAQLSKRHLNTTTQQQLDALFARDPVQGQMLATGIANGSAGSIGDINRLTAQIAKSAADAAGITAGDVFSKQIAKDSSTLKASLAEQKAQTQLLRLLISKMQGKLSGQELAQELKALERNLGRKIFSND